MCVCLCNRSKYIYIAQVYIRLDSWTSAQFNLRCIVLVSISVTTAITAHAHLSYTYTHLTHPVSYNPYNVCAKTNENPKFNCTNLNSFFIIFQFAPLSCQGKFRIRTMMRGSFCMNCKTQKCSYLLFMISIFNGNSNVDDGNDNSTHTKRKKQNRQWQFVARFVRVCLLDARIVKNEPSSFTIEHITAVIFPHTQFASCQWIFNWTIFSFFFFRLLSCNRQYTNGVHSRLIIADETYQYPYASSYGSVKHHRECSVDWLQSKFIFFSFLTNSS